MRKEKRREEEANGKEKSPNEQRAKSENDDIIEGSEKNYVH